MARIIFKNLNNPKANMSFMDSHKLKRIKFSLKISLFLNILFIVYIIYINYGDKFRASF